MLHTVVFIGRSGCGKGTQAALLKDRFHKRDLEKRPILYVETGDRFRHFIRENNYSSKLSNAVYELDLRQPDFLACYMWASMLVEELLPDMHVVFDGAPRSRAEAELMTTAFEFYKRERPTVIYLNVGRKWSEEKLLARGRSDDRSLLKIGKRMKWFEDEVMPAIEYFRNDNRYRFIEVNGEQPMEKVHADIIAAYDYKE
jgi:adenylate kinase family enzyme